MYSFYTISDGTLWNVLERHGTLWNALECLRHSMAFHRYLLLSATIRACSASVTGLSYCAHFPMRNSSAGQHYVVVTRRTAVQVLG